MQATISEKLAAPAFTATAEKFLAIPKVINKLKFMNKKCTVGKKSIGSIN